MIQYFHGSYRLNGVRPEQSDSLQEEVYGNHDHPDGHAHPEGVEQVDSKLLSRLSKSANRDEPAPAVTPSQIPFLTSSGIISDQLGSSSLADNQSSDFGWRFQGRLVGVLPDRSVKFVPSEQSAKSVLDPYCSNLATLQACLQCGTCTANCSLVGENSHFPRQQMNLFQMGLHDRLVADTSVWHCYNCGDCSKRCPSGAQPGKLMGAVRQMAVEWFAFPSFMASLFNRPRCLWLVFASAMVLILSMIGIGGSFSPATNRVHYASMLPHLTLNVFFLGFTGLALAGMVVGVVRAWKTYQSESLWQANHAMLLRAFRAAIIDILAHRRFTDCGEHRLRGCAHWVAFYGFMVLAGLAGVAAILIATGGNYPFPVTHPLKVLANIAAAAMILGIAYFIYERWNASRQGDASTYFDWMLLMSLLLIGFTGLLCEVFRYTNIAWVAYPMYFLHLVLVFVLLVSLPYSKLAHMCYRTLAITSREYDALLARGAAGQNVPISQERLMPLLDRPSLSLRGSA